MNIFLFLSGFFFLTLIVGGALERLLKVPWIFAALLVGAVLAVYNPFTPITSSATFKFLAELGMYFLLFLIGLELDVKSLISKSGFIISATVFIILTEAFFGSLLVHFIFNYSWLISILIALSFATVGEAVLIPILDEFNIVNTDLGQAIIGIGSLDDIIEIGTLILAAVLISSRLPSKLNPAVIFLSLLVLLVISFILIKFRRETRRLNFSRPGILLLFSLSIFFLFIGIGQYAEAAAIAALLAGISLKIFIPNQYRQELLQEFTSLTYGLLAPIFFLWVGSTMDFRYLITYPLLILLVVLVSKAAKLGSSYIIAGKKLGHHQAILLGIGLSVRFSTSIIIIKLLFENQIIKSDIYSIIIASSIVFKFIIPPLFSYLLIKWKIAELRG